MAKGPTIMLRDMKKDRAAQKKRPKLPIYRRPKTREECGQFERPCPFVACRHHLFLDVKPNGSIAFPFGHDVAAIETMPHTCALDAAEDGERTLREIARAYDVTHQAIRLIYWQAMANMGSRDVTREVAAGTDGCQNPAPREGPERPVKTARLHRRSGKHLQEMLHE